MRYSRQEVFIGTRNHKKLQKALVTIIGCGGTGSAAAEYLARAGVNLRLIDRDIVELSNIQRQLYTEEDIGRPKAEALGEHLEDINGEINVEAISDDLNSSNIDVLAVSSIVLDGTDNMQTRFLINDFCLKNKIPFTYGAAIKSEGLFTLIVPKETPCIRCFIPGGGADTCETVGVLGPVVGLIGTISAVETMKFLMGKECIKGQLFHFNAYKNKFELIELKKNKECKACNGNYEFLDMPINSLTRLCGGTCQLLIDVDVPDISNKLKKNKEFEVIKNTRNFSQIVYRSYIISLFQNRIIIQNTGSKDAKRQSLSEKEAKIIANKIIGK